MYTCEPDNVHYPAVRGHAHKTSVCVCVFVCVCVCVKVMCSYVHMTPNTCFPYVYQGALQPVIKER